MLLFTFTFVFVPVCLPKENRFPKPKPPYTDAATFPIQKVKQPFHMKNQSLILLKCHFCGSSAFAVCRVFCMLSECVCVCVCGALAHLSLYREHFSSSVVATYPTSLSFCAALFLWLFTFLFICSAFALLQLTLIYFYLRGGLFGQSCWKNNFRILCMLILLHKSLIL